MSNYLSNVPPTNRTLLHLRVVDVHVDRCRVLQETEGRPLQDAEGSGSTQTGDRVAQQCH